MLAGGGGNNCRCLTGCTPPADIPIGAQSAGRQASFEQAFGPHDSVVNISHATGHKSYVCVSQQTVHTSLIRCDMLSRRPPRRSLPPAGRILPSRRYAQPVNVYDNACAGEFTSHDRGNVLNHEPGSMSTNEEARLLCLIYQYSCLLYTSPSPRDGLLSRMPSSA